MILKALASLFLLSSVNLQTVNANSLGLGIPCDVANPILGTPTRTKPLPTDPVRAMWWATPPQFAGNQYTLRTSDSSTPASDPTSYVPGQWTELYIRATVQDMQYTGLLMYVEDANKVKVGEWQLPPREPFHQDPNSGCITHANADPKPYLTKFRVRFPAGTGTVTIRALVKYGLAFPALQGAFYWPNSQNVVLTEGAAAPPQVWFQGQVGQSCNTVCAAQNLGCDLATLQSTASSMAPASFYDAVRKYSSCTLPIMRGCSSATPSVGRNGCYYHDDTCTRNSLLPEWVRGDPCAGLPDFPTGSPYQNANNCCKYQGSKWCASFYATNAPTASDGQPWSKIADCMPVGGWPTSSPPTPTPAARSPAKIDCATALTSDQDGQRLCACTNGVAPKTDAPAVTTAPPATTTAPPVVGTTMVPTQTDPCANVNCGAFGLCSYGTCKCTNGYTGAKCDVPPPVTCTVNCASQNKATCTSANVCGACLPGTVPSGVNCVVQCDQNACAGLNRMSCMTANVCGACQPGFVENPTKNAAQPCIQPTLAPTVTPTTPAPQPTTAPPANNNNIPQINFAQLLSNYASNTNANWCTQCAAFSSNCVMGCAGDAGGGGACPADACPRVFTFIKDSAGNAIWNINIAQQGSPYRAFAYVPICTNSPTNSCQAPFTLSFSFQYAPGNNPTTTFSGQQDYLKLLFWGDGNNILGIKNGLLLGIPGDGRGDLVGSTTATAVAFSQPLVRDTWYNVAITFTVTGTSATLSFAINGSPVGKSGTVGTSNSGLQFGAYVWGNSFFTVQYKNIAITPAGVVPTTLAPGTQTPTTQLTPTTNTAVTTNTPTTKTAVTTNTPSTAAATPTTAAATTLTPTTSAVTNPPTTAGGFISISVTGPSYSPRCEASSGRWFLDGYSWTFSTTISNGVITSTNPPMNENGACTEQLTAYWYLNGQAVPITLSNPFNFGAPTTLGVDAVNGAPVVTGNTMVFNLQDNMATPGATFILTPPTACTAASAQPTISTAFTIANFVIQAPGNNGAIPAVNAVPTITNNLPVANRAAVGGNTLAPTWSPSAAPTTATPTTATPTTAAANPTTAQATTATPTTKTATTSTPTTAAAATTAVATTVATTAVATTAAATTALPTTVKPTTAANNGQKMVYTYTVQSSWQSGFCGAIVGNYNGGDRSIKFDVPANYVLTSSWNIGAVYDKVNGVITGSLPNYITNTNKYFNGGLCMSFTDPKTLITATATGFSNGQQRSVASLASLVAIDKYVVVYSLTLTGYSKNQIDKDATFANEFLLEVSRAATLQEVQTQLLSYVDSTDGTGATVAFSFSCYSNDQISFASNFEEALTTLLTLDNERLASYPVLQKAQLSSLLISFPTQVFTNDTPNSPATNNNDAGTTGLSGGAIAGIIIAIIVAIAFVAFIVYKVNSNKSSPSDNNKNIQLSTGV